VTLTAPPAHRSAAAELAARRRRSVHARRRRRRLVVAWLVVALVVGAAAFTAGLVAAPIDFASTPVPPKSVLLLDRHGRGFATVRSPETMVEVSGEKIPKVMREAIVAAEDERFYAHRGVDPLGLVRAAYRDVTGTQIQGGSTITQQYVKNVYVGNERTALRKLREAALAVRLERHLSKDEILTRYLNGLYLGNGTYGVQAASQFYFGVPIDKLDLDIRTGKRSDSLALARAATLAGMAPGPSLWNPLHDKKAARARELYTLNRMVANGMISAQQASAAFGHALPTLYVRSQPDAPTVAPEFRDRVAAQLHELYSDNELFRSGGMRVTTTLDLNLQKAAVAALTTVLPAKDDPEAVVVATDPRTGDLLAMTERKDGGYTRGGLNLATQALRSSGSTIKPFTLAQALMEGHSVDEGRYGPNCIRIGPGYRPCNAGDSEAGYFTLASALQDSVNTVYAPLAVEVGLDKVISLAKRSGMAIGKLDRSCGATCPSYSLGVPITPLSEALAYGTLVNHGVHQDVRTLLSTRSPAGTFFSAPATPPGQRVMPATVADAVTAVMQGVVDHGTATAARQPFPVFGKTGTTDEYTDAWFTGCTRSVCITVWMGYDKPYLPNGQPHSMRGVEGVRSVYGGTLPAKIFASTWDNYRLLQNPTPVVKATPTPTRTYYAPPRTPTPVLSPTRKPVPKPTPAKTTAAPQPTATATPVPPPPTSPPVPVASPPGG
jgi:penicillin-binding protein 1A